MHSLRSDSGFLREISIFFSVAQAYVGVLNANIAEAKNSNFPIPLNIIALRV